MNDEWTKRLANLTRLSAMQRLSFFELLAHNLTVGARGGWSEPGLSAEERVESLKQFNECLHRSTARIWVQRLSTHEWKDEDFVSLLADTDSKLHPRLRGSVAQAFDISYASAAT